MSFLGDARLFRKNLSEPNLKSMDIKDEQEAVNSITKEKLLTEKRPEEVNLEKEDDDYFPWKVNTHSDAKVPFF